MWINARLANEETDATRMELKARPIVYLSRKENIKDNWSFRRHKNLKK